MPDTAALNALAATGMRVLLRRQVANLLLGLVGGWLLARLLDPAEFGVYAIVTFLITALTVIGDLGVGASLVQRKEEVSDEHLQSAFTVQCALAFIVVTLVWAAVPFAVRFFPKLPPDAAWMARIFSLSLFLTAIRSGSVIRLERALKFAPLARAEVAETAVYQVAAVVLAFLGAGVWSFIVASLLRGVLGASLLFAASPWPVRWRTDRAQLAGLVRYGVAFQAGGLLNALSGWVTPLVVGTLVGPAAVGYLGFATSQARRPLLVVEATMRVAFPHFSRLQADQERLQETIASYLTGFVWFVTAWLVIVAVIARPAIALLYTGKWLPAYGALCLFAAALPAEAIGWTMGFAFAAVNRNWEEVRIIGCRSVLLIVLAGVLVPRLGFTGVAWAHFIATWLIGFWLIHAFAPGYLPRQVRQLAWIAVPTALAWGSGWMAVAAVPGTGVASLAGKIALGLLTMVTVYLGFSWLMAPRAQREGIRALSAPLLGRLGIARGQVTGQRG